MTQDELNKQLIDGIKQLNVSMVEEALAEGANPNAIAYGDVVETITLNELRSDPYAIEILFDRPIAIPGQDLIRPEVEPIFLALIQKGLDPTILIRDRPLLSQAARYGFDTCVLALLENGADVNALDRERAVVMHFAVGHCKLETIKALIEKGADVNALDLEGLPPLNSLFPNEHLDVVDFLRSHGAKKLQWVAPNVLKLV